MGSELTRQSCTMLFDLTAYCEHGMRLRHCAWRMSAVVSRGTQLNTFEQEQCLNDEITVMRHRATFRSTTDRMYDSGKNFWTL